MSFFFLASLADSISADASIVCENDSVVGVAGHANFATGFVVAEDDSAAGLAAATVPGSTTGIVWADVVDVAAELATGVALTAQAKILGFVNERVSPSIFGGPDSFTFVQARAYLAAHFGLLVKRGSTGVGAVTSKSEGGASISYANLAMPSPLLLGSTQYGQNFLALVQVAPLARSGFVLGRFFGGFWGIGGGRC